MVSVRVELVRTSAVALAPESAYARFMLGFCHYVANDFATALPALQKAMALDPADGNAAFYLAMTHEALAQTPATANGHSRQRHEGDAALDGELPGTLKRSSKEARETFTRALASAVQVYGEGDQAFRAAYVEFKRTFEKRGDHWIPKQAAKPAG